MLPRATLTRNDRESVRGKIGGRTHEISRLIGRSLRAAIDLSRRSARTRSRSTATCCRPTAAPAPRRSPAPTSRWPTRSSWLRAQGSLARPEPLINSVSAVSVGVIDGEPRLDLMYEEDVARRDRHERRRAPATGEFVEVQGTAEGAPFDRDELDALLDLAVAGCAAAAPRRSRSARCGDATSVSVAARHPQRQEARRAAAHPRAARARRRGARARRRRRPTTRCPRPARRSPTTR